MTLHLSERSVSRLFVGPTVASQDAGLVMKVWVGLEILNQKKAAKTPDMF